MTTLEYGSLRSDDDHWDIVSNVGYTALLVAGWRALHTTGPKPLVQDEYAKHFITASADPYLEGLLANPRTSEDGTAFPRLYGVQTRFFDDFFNCADEAGIRQAVIVAAGLDCRAYRLDWQPGTTVFEIDVPVEWLVEHGWAVDPVRSTLELQVGYGLTPPDVDVKIDSFMRSQYITAVRA